MEDILNIFMRTIFVFVFLFVLVKLMGKKQVSQMNLFDYLIGITIGSIAADISLDLEKDMFSGVLCLFIYGLFSIFISYITMKSINARRFFLGVPTILIENNKIIQGGLKKAKIDINELLAEARSKGYFNLEDIGFAIMETNGDISFMPVNSSSPVTKKDIKIKESSNKDSLIANVIIDSRLLEKNLSDMNKSKKWLDNILKIKGYNNYDDILLATLDINDKVVVYNKNIKSEKSSILE